jgi:hypothetical protein
MNREDIIRMAREAGCKPFRSPEHWDDVQVFATPDVLERFAALVAAAAKAEENEELRQGLVRMAALYERRQTTEMLYLKSMSHQQYEQGESNEWRSQHVPETKIACGR